MDNLNHVHDHAVGVVYVSWEVIACVWCDFIVALEITHSEYDVSLEGCHGSQPQPSQAENDWEHLYAHEEIEGDQMDYDRLINYAGSTQVSPSQWEQELHPQDSNFVISRYYKESETTTPPAPWKRRDDVDWGIFRPTHESSNFIQLIFSANESGITSQIEQIDM